MEDLSQAQFNGWARVEVMGHQTHIGYVKTEAYGAAVLFRIDTPELQEREYEMTEPGYVGGRWVGAGSKVKRCASPGVSVLVGAGSIYRIVPCSQEAALKAIESLVRSELMEVKVPTLHVPALEDSRIEDGDATDNEDFIEDSEGSTHGEGERFYSPSNSAA